MVDCVTNPHVQKENSTEGRNEGKSAASDPESNPVISCTVGQSCSALSIYGHGICMEGNPGLMDQDLLKFLCMVTSGKRSGPIVEYLWFLEGEANQISLLWFFLLSINQCCRGICQNMMHCALIKQFWKHYIMSEEYVSSEVLRPTVMVLWRPPYVSVFLPLSIHLYRAKRVHQSTKKMSSLIKSFDWTNWHTQHLHGCFSNTFFIFWFTAEVSNLPTVFPAKKVKHHWNIVIQNSYSAQNILNLLSWIKRKEKRLFI